jgi:rRNA processing/ribosome biogenesis
MDDHLLKTLLQLHLATDSSAVLHLPYILGALVPQTFNPPSAHTQKWTTRINSLIHSKDSGARWAGLSIALRTSVLAKSLMMECAQSWVGVVLPMLLVRLGLSIYLIESLT